jgi:hypothetical protein
MSFIDQFETQLVAAGRRRIERRLRNRIARRLRVPRSRNAAIALAALVLAAPAAAATLGWNPFAGPRHDLRRGTPTIVHGQVDASLTRILAPLRRPQSDADRGVATQRAANAFGSDVSGVNLDGVRVLDSQGGLVLVPVERYGLNLERAARANPALPAPDPARFSNAVCLYEPGSDGSGGRPCYTAATILGGTALGSQAGVVTGLVPDGVAQVRLIAGAGGAAAVANVRENVFVAGPPASEAPAAVEWLDARGQTIRRIDLAGP